MRLLFSLLLLSGAAWAQTLELPARVEAAAGGFVSLPVAAEGGNRLVVEAPAALQVVGAPELREGRALVNLLTNPDAPAGDYGVRVRLFAGEREVAAAELVVAVAPKAGLELRAPEGDTVVNGEEVRYTLLVTNTGNAPDTVRLEVSSTLPARLEPDVATLEPGEVREVALRLLAEGRSRDVAVVEARSGLEPDLRDSAIVRTTIVPFAGAEGLDGPALVYALEARAGYGTGLDYALGASVDGELSDFVSLRSDLAFADERPLGSLSLRGESWGVGYSGSEALQRLDGSYGPLQSFVALPLPTDGFSAGVAYRDDPLNVSLTHRSAEENSDALRASYTVALGPAVRLSPFVALGGVGRYTEEGYRVVPAFGLSASAQARAVVGTARLGVTVPCRGCERVGDLWRLDVSASSRRQSPVGVQGQVAVADDFVAVTAAAREELSEELTLSQRLGYGGSFGLRSGYSLSAGATYRPSLLPLTLSGTLGGSLQEEGFRLVYGATGRYDLGAVAFAAVFAAADELSYGASLAYSGNVRDLALELEASYQHEDAEDSLLLELEGEYGGLEGALGGGYNLTTRSYLAEGSFLYDITPRYGVFGAFGLEDDALSFSLGGSFSLVGGVATPERVVSVFGGRAVGVVSGVVFRDLNRNGARDAQEPALAGAEVQAGALTATTAADGAYRLALPAGNYRLSLGGLSANLGLTGEVAVEVVEGESLEALLAVEETVSVTGVVVDDADRDGARGEAEGALPYVRVTLVAVSEVATAGPAGGRPPAERREALTNDRGEFFFQNLVPGRYTVALDVSSLPERYEPTTPPSEVALELGPSPRLTLGATARPKEVKQTLKSGDVSLFVTPRPNPAPPGASLELVVETKGEPEGVSALVGGQETPLEAADNGTFRGRVAVPKDAQGVLPITVTAQRGEASATQQALVIINPGAPLATVTVSPALADPEQTLNVAGELFFDAADVYLLVGGERLELRREVYTFSQDFTAPSEPGSYEVELWADEERVASTRFRVDEPN